MKRGSVWALLLCIILATVSVMPHTAWAQPRTLAQWQSTLTSSWLMTVQGETATRTLRVTGMAQKADGALVLETSYGLTSARQGPMRAEITSDQKLVFTTQADAKVVASEAANGDFVGTITFKNGMTKNVTLSKMSDSPAHAAAQPTTKVNAVANTTAEPAGAGGTKTAAADVPKAKVTLFYFGTDSCPTCRGWKSFDLPKLKETEAFKSIRYVEVQKAIPAPIPSADAFPSDLASLREVISNRFKGRVSSPMFAMVVGDEVTWAYLGAPDNKQVVDAIVAATK